jgi:phosphatidylinositol glycan class K
VIVSSSRYWFNYRHAANALGIYNTLKKNGIPDSQIILMLADEYATNARNPFKNGIYTNGVKNENWYTGNDEIDYRGSDVTVKNFFGAALGTAPKSIQPNSNSSLLIYVSGHGGDQFFKFQDEEEMTAQDIANLMDTLRERNLFKKALFIADTCQAFTLFDKVETENVLCLGTSKRGENAYAHHQDNDLGLSVIERWTHAFLTQYTMTTNLKATLGQFMVDPFRSRSVLGAHVGIKENSIRFHDVLVSDFFGISYKENSRKAKTISKTLVVEKSSFDPEISIVKSTLNEVERSLSVDSPIEWESIKGTAIHRGKNDTTLEPTDPTFAILVFGLLSCLAFANFIEKKTRKLKEKKKVA